jgi:hypothetical protein
MTGTTITPYLFFGGLCEEALEFYRKALGAEVEMRMRFDESPDPTPPGMLQAGFEKKVMHATFRVRGLPLMASDGCDDKSKFDGFRLALALPFGVGIHGGVEPPRGTGAGKPDDPKGRRQQEGRGTQQHYPTVPVRQPKPKSDGPE